MRDESEHDWMGRQDEDTLARYIARSIALLDEVGLRPGGLTQPCSFSGDETVYAHAVQRAFREHGRADVTYYFLHVLGRAPHVRPSVTLCDRRQRSCVVSVPSATADAFWVSQPGEARRRGLTVPATVDALADPLLDPRRERGRLVDLLRTGSDLIVLTALAVALFGRQRPGVARPGGGGRSRDEPPRRPHPLAAHGRPRALHGHGRGGPPLDPGRQWQARDPPR